MGRPGKLPGGRPRTILLREDHVRVLEEAARAAGVDVSDLVRIAIDATVPAGEPARVVRHQAGFELCWRTIARKPGLRRAVLDGVAGREMVLPLDRPPRPADVRWVRRAVALAGLLALTPPVESAAEFPPRTWATAAPDALVRVLAHPAAWAAEVGSGGHPVVFAVAGPARPAAGPGEREARPPEVLYQDPADALVELLTRGQVVEVTDRYPTGPGPGLAWYRVR